MNIRPMIVVTGALHPEKKTQATPAEKHEIENIVLRFNEKLRELRILATPYGTLLDPAKLGELQVLLASTDNKIKAFNENATSACRMKSYVLWEPLGMARRAAIIAWIPTEPRAAEAVPFLTGEHPA
jgi:hypothetical protein